MDKLTVFDVLAFLIPGAILNGSIYFVLLNCKVDTSFINSDNHPIINSIAFICISYVCGFIISEFAFRLTHKRMDRKGLSIAAIINTEFDDLFLKNLNALSTQKLKISFIEEGGSMNTKNLSQCFFIWVEAIAMRTTYGLVTVLHGQYMLFRNLFLAAIIACIAIITALFVKQHLHLYTQFYFMLFTSVIVLLIPISYFIYTVRFRIYCKVAVRAAYSFFTTSTN
jgi:hypothetical protein